MSDSIARLQGKSVDYDALKRRAWHEDEILVLNLREDSLSWSDKELLRIIGDRRYGKRKAT